MSEPARSYPPTEAGSRPAPGPLRDWLAAMKANTPGETREPVRAEPQAVEAPVRQPQQDVRPVRAVETGWSPRLVTPAEAPRAMPEDADLSELMAENMVLKAKLRLEAGRHEELQELLAEEIRELRQHVSDEIGSIEDLRAEQEEIRLEREEFRSERERFRAEREEIRAERDRATTERDALRAERSTLAAERDALREERDLWRARSEALAQPLFQIQRR